MSKIKQIIEDFLLSFKSEKGGFSARKLTSFTLIVCVVFAHYMIFRNENALDVFTTVILYDFCMVAVLLGLIDATDLIKHKREMMTKSKDDEPK